MNENELIESWKEEENVLIEGWKFPHLDGRVFEEDTPWDYMERAQTLMRDAEAGLNLTNTKYDFIRSKQLEVREDGVGLISDDEAPVLPDFQQYLTAPAASEKKERAEPTAEQMP